MRSISSRRKGLSCEANPWLAEAQMSMIEIPSDIGRTFFDWMSFISLSREIVQMLKA